MMFGPNITGDFSNHYRGFINAASGAFHHGGNWAKFIDWGSTGSAMNYDCASFTASRSNAVYGANGIVQPASARLLPCIKI